VEREPESEPLPDAVRPEPRVALATASVGTTFAVTLNETLSTETNQVGDMFTATLEAPIRSVDGDVVVPAGAVVRGRLTQVEAGPRGESNSLAFESISLDNAA
jgi:hypothetical protein